MANQKKQYTAWYKHPEVESNLITLSPNQIAITHNSHKKGVVSLPLNPNLKSTVAVRATEDGKYELIAGMNSFVRAKVFDQEVQAYITEDDRETFKIKYNLDI